MGGLGWRLLWRRRRRLFDLVMGEVIKLDLEGCGEGDV